MWSNLATIRFAHSHKRYPTVAKRIGMRSSGVIDNWKHKLSLKNGDFKTYIHNHIALFLERPVAYLSAVRKKIM